MVNEAVLLQRYSFECEAIIAWLQCYSLSNPLTGEKIEPTYAHCILKSKTEHGDRLIREAGFLNGGQVKELQLIF